MTKKFIQLLLLLLFIGSPAFAQFVGFEDAIPQNFKCANAKELALSTSFYKEGTKSLEWNFTPGSVIDVAREKPFNLKDENGITLWIYNEKPQTDSLRFEFYSPSGSVSYQFGFHLLSAGWRACWISFKHMQGDHKNNKIAGYRIVSPNRKGRVFIDRLTFPVKKINDRTTPDMQMPTNNSLSNRDLWHWCRVWQWEQFKYDLPLPTSLTADEKKDLATVEKRLTEALDIYDAPKKWVNKAYHTFEAANIRPSGQGFTGAPIVAPDELNRKKGEMSWNNLEEMMAGFAYDAYYNHSEQSAKNYFLVWDYAIDQGFAFGSGMGTNHHYGYQVRKIYTTAWLMRDAIWKAPNRDKILSALVFWSALQETRLPYQYGRDELLDSWHTLLMAKTVSALLFTNECERARALAGLTRWLCGSLQYSPGTIAGIKVDGTTFHHGGFYPAYTTGVLAMVGQYISLTNHTRYVPTVEARQILKEAFLSMRNYSNKYEWGVGISGRHPFGSSMSDEDVASFAYLALAGDLSGEGNFSGSSSLEGKNGMFAMKLMERELKNFTPDFVARKSVFCFDNRMVCLGTGINNSNSSYPTETTLFQSTFSKGKSDIYVDGKIKDEPFQKDLNDNKAHFIQDGYNNYYFFKGENVQVQIANQESRHEKTRVQTRGSFASAYINHGVAPKDAAYEYLVLIQPTKEEVAAARRKAPYQVLHKDNTAHVVADAQTGITAYAAFDNYNPQNDELLSYIPAETMVMQKKVGANVLMSVCDPNLNISEKTYTTKEPSRPIEKKLVLKGNWNIATPNAKVSVKTGLNETVLTVICQHGQPVEFTLKRN